MAVAALVAIALAAMLGWWGLHGRGSGRLVEIDQAEPRSAAFQVDVNTAGMEELSQLPGIGPALAQRIIESREADGPFLSPDDLQRVRDIGPKKMERLRPYLRFTADTSSSPK